MHESPNTEIANGRWRSSDLYLCGALASLDYQLLGLEHEGRRCFFVFAVADDEIDEFKATLQSWDLDTLHVRASSYADAVRRLKNAVMRGRS